MLVAGCDDAAHVHRAAAWVATEMPGTVADVGHFGLVESFVDALQLPAIPKSKLSVALKDWKEPEPLELAAAAAPAAPRAAAPPKVELEVKLEV